MPEVPQQGSGYSANAEKSSETIFKRVTFGPARDDCCRKRSAHLLKYFCALTCRSSDANHAGEGDAAKLAFQLPKSERVSIDDVGSASFHPFKAHLLRHPALHRCTIYGARLACRLCKSTPA